jgi:hypothetical protein
MHSAMVRPQRQKYNPDWCLFNPQFDSRHAPRKRGG